MFENILEEALEVLQRLTAAGHQAYIAGGAVRDTILGKTPKDWDVATSATPEEVDTLFRKTVPTGLKHGTVSIFINGIKIETTTFRIDSPESDGRRPDNVTFSKNPEDDALRRDSTVNALFMDQFGTIIDYVDGRTDLEHRLIRAVGDPMQRIVEDSLRMMRFIRQACQHNMAIEPATLYAVRKNAALITRVSPERIFMEIELILDSPSPARGLQLLADTGLLAHILPEIQEMVGFEQRNPHHSKDIFGHTLDVVTVSPPELRLAALLHDVGKPATFSIDETGIGHFYGHEKAGAEIAEQILRRFNASGAVIDQCMKLVNAHMDHLPANDPRSIRRYIQRMGDLAIPSLQLMLADRSTSVDRGDEQIAEVISATAAILAEAPALTVKDLAISGRDLIAAGFAPGPKMGETMKRLLDVVIDNPDNNNHASLMALATTL